MEPDQALNEKAANFFALFASSSTLVCCALPAIFVALGAGASFASLVSSFPFLITPCRKGAAIKRNGYFL